MHNRTWRFVGAAAAFVALTTAAVGCGSDGGGSASSSSTTKAESGSGEAVSTDLDAIQVPSDYGTIQEAVSAAEPGDLILVDEGVYNEAVDVETPDITIRGVSRTKTILDGEFKLENGIRVLDTDGVVVENMTARNYTSNGFYWTGSDRYRGSYLTAYRNGDYGLYAYDAYHGQFDHSLGSGSPDAGVYIGECYECDAVVDTVISEYNGLGYSGTNSGGDLYIVNSTFRHNRAGVVPNSGAYELCYPNRQTTIVGNTIHDNNEIKDNPGISVSLLAGGMGIVMAGTVANDIERNLVYNQDRWGIIALSLPEEDAADVVPPTSQDDMSCEEAKKLPLADPDDVPPLVVWESRENKVIGNTVENSGIADLAIGTLGADVASLNNCWSDNTFATSEPPDIEAVAPCEGTGTENFDGQADITVLADPDPTPPDDQYQKMPVPEVDDQPEMPDPLTTPAEKFEKPERPDLDSITVPSKPGN